MDAKGPLYDDVVKLLAKHDPMRLVAIGAPLHEYQHEAQAILVRWQAEREKSQLLTIVREVFERAFGAKEAANSDFVALSRDLRRLLKRHGQA